MCKAKRTKEKKKQIQSKSMIQPSQTSKYYHCLSISHCLTLNLYVSNEKFPVFFPCLLISFIVNESKVLPLDTLTHAQTTHLASNIRNFTQLSKNKNFLFTYTSPNLYYLCTKNILCKKIFKKYLVIHKKPLPIILQFE